MVIEPPKASAATARFEVPARRGMQAPGQKDFFEVKESIKVGRLTAQLRSNPALGDLGIPMERPIKTRVRSTSIARWGSGRSAKVWSRDLEKPHRGHLPGALYPINPKTGSILGLNCYKNVKEIPDRWISPPGHKSRRKSAVPGVITATSWARSLYLEDSARGQPEDEFQMAEVAALNGVRLLGRIARA